MKTIQKRVASVMLAVLLVFSSGVIAFAQEGNPAPSNSSAVDTKDIPIIVVPGIMGSKMYSDVTCTRKIWDPQISDLLNPIFKLGEHIAPDRVLYTREPVDQQVVSKGNREYGATDAYKNLVERLCDDFPERSVYFYSYDFRDSCKNAAKELEDFIEKNDFEKVDLVCHSMGGLVASNYALKNSEKIHRVITLATPFEGSPQIVDNVLTTDLLGNSSTFWHNINFENFVSNFIADPLLVLNGITKDLKCKLISTAELCPTQAYVNNVSFFECDKNGTFKNTIHTLDYDAFKEVGRRIWGENYDKAVSEQNAILVDGKNILLTLDCSYFAIGTEQHTMSSIAFYSEASCSDVKIYECYHDRNGDGRVPYLSASANRALEAPEYSERVKCFNKNHGALASDSQPVSWVVDVLKAA